VRRIVLVLSVLCAACGAQTDDAELSALAESTTWTAEEPVCGNGILEPEEQCEVGAQGPGNAKRWTSEDCTSDCKAKIYVSTLAPIADHCLAPRTPAFFACTLSCTTDDDCPALPQPYKRPRCNLIGQHTCDQPCDDESDCLPDSKLTCFFLPGAGISACTNAF
jgi:hypothetical protein